MSDEMKVILIAIAAFIVINIFMWTFIAISNKRTKRRMAGTASPAAVITDSERLARTIELSTGAVAEEYARAVRKQELTPVESIVMIHTDEVI